MTHKFFTIGCVGAFALTLAMSSGCVGVQGPGVGIMSIPAPVLPYHQQQAEDHAFESHRYGKVAILPPIMEENHIGLDPPTDDEIVRALEKIRPVGGAVPGLEVTYRNIKGITKEPIADYVDPVRVLPMVGPVQVHHVHYKCTVYFEEVTHVGYPIPHQIKVEDGIEVLYIDKDHLHRIGGGEVNAPMM